MQIDPRGPRLAAALSSVVLLLTLHTGSRPLLAAQTLVFALGAIGGLRLAPYIRLCQVLVLPRLAPPAETADERTLRFDQGVCLVFAVVATLGCYSGVTWLGLLAGAAAFTASFVNAAFGYCVGCEVYLVLRRAQGRPTAGT
ncbi:DUF4395 domain-containing protein [Kitasatospora brasiliensis]|uniref:DUF4395 domain-containing protein n=1 Tax=Kitasatospora brasiliensis TaxID=3058040 RepID=UPI0029311631|nr:DUF4395 domain-containing protein [Kitasatospora sp. K002]